MKFTLKYSNISGLFFDGIAGFSVKEGKGQQVGTKSQPVNNNKNVDKAILYLL